MIAVPDGLMLSRDFLAHPTTYDSDILLHPRVGDHRHHSSDAPHGVPVRHQLDRLQLLRYQRGASSAIAELTVVCPSPNKEPP